MSSSAGKLRAMNDAFRKAETRKLYRNCLKLANLFHWRDENGVEWFVENLIFIIFIVIIIIIIIIIAIAFISLIRSMILKVTLRKEFEAANEEKDPEILARLVVQGKEAFEKLQEKACQIQLIKLPSFLPLLLLL